MTSPGRFIVPVDESELVNTVIAWVPGLGDSFAVVPTLLDAEGQQIDREVADLVWHESFFFDEAFDEVLNEFAGSLRVEGVEDLFLTVLRLELTGDGGGFQLTSIPPLRHF